MNADFSREYRLYSLLSSLNLNTRAKGFNYAMIKAVAAGMALVEKYFDEILNNAVLISDSGYGTKMICDLLDLNEFDFETVKECLSQCFADYEYGDLQDEYLKCFDGNMSLSISNFILSIAGGKDYFLSQILKNIPFLEKYLCPGVVPQASGVKFDFDALDAFDFNADDWDKIAKTSFNFIDSLGGAQ